jgi:hypothetical protein
MHVERQRDLAVPQDVLHHLGMDAPCEQERCACVPEIVNPHSRQLGPLQHIPELAPDIPIIERRADRGCEDVAGRLPPRARQQPLAVLLRPVRVIRSDPD